jgi:hypothetical protein
LKNEIKREGHGSYMDSSAPRVLFAFIAKPATEPLAFLPLTFSAHTLLIHTQPRFQSYR